MFIIHDRRLQMILHSLVWVLLGCADIHIFFFLWSVKQKRGDEGMPGIERTRFFFLQFLLNPYFPYIKCRTGTFFCFLMYSHTRPNPTRHMREAIHERGWFFCVLYCLVASFLLLYLFVCLLCPIPGSPSFFFSAFCFVFFCCSLLLFSFFFLWCSYLVPGQGGGVLFAFFCSFAIIFVFGFSVSQSVTT